MEANVARRGELSWRLWALVPLLLLVAVVALFATTGGSVTDLLGRTPPAAAIHSPTLCPSTASPKSLKVNRPLGTWPRSLLISPSTSQIHAPLIFRAEELKLLLNSENAE